MDLIVRNAGILRDGELRRVDVGIDGGVIGAVIPALEADGRELDAAGCLVVPGLIETHIHLDKTCILDRCHIEEGTVAEAVRVTAAAKRGTFIGGPSRCWSVASLTARCACAPMSNSTPASA